MLGTTFLLLLMMMVVVVVVEMMMMLMAMTYFQSQFIGHLELHKFIKKNATASALLVTPPS
jgi:hypothetical protein